MQPKPGGGPVQAQCRECGTTMWSVGTEHFHVDGSSRLFEMIFGEVTELNEAIMPFEMWACPSCRRIELRVPEHYEGPEAGEQPFRYPCPSCGEPVYRGQPECLSCGRELTP